MIPNSLQSTIGQFLVFGYEVVRVSVVGNAAMLLLLETYWELEVANSDVSYSGWFLLESVVAIRPSTSKGSDIEMDSFVGLQSKIIMKRSVTSLEFAGNLLRSNRSTCTGLGSLSDRLRR